MNIIAEHRGRRGLRRSVAVAAAVLGAFAAVAAAAQELQYRGSVELRPCPIPDADGEMLCGSFAVYENRGAHRGRTIALNLAVLPALRPNPRPDPIFWIAGGPGGSATAGTARFATHWMREQRDVVLVDQRGTGGSNPLQCALPGGPDDAQGYLAGSFADVGLLRRCKRQLAAVANLRMYTTDFTVDDLDDVRAAMGYERINILAGSWGTRTALLYLRRHSEHVRRAIFNGAVPLALTYPLYHAQGAQRALDLAFARCAAEAECAAAFQDLQQEFEAVLDRLDQGPVEVRIAHPDTGAPVAVELDRAAFGEAMRYLLVANGDLVWMPLYVHLAYAGDFAPITQFAVEVNRFYKDRLMTGLLLSIVCTEDVPRIDPARIPALTEGTFFGDTRVRQTLAVCQMWPTRRLPAAYGRPVVSNVPVLIWSGAFDPSLPPKWGSYAARTLPRSIHLVVPGAHGVSGPCFEAVNQRFLNQASLSGLNTACTEAIEPPPFELPE